MSKRIKLFNSDEHGGTLISTHVNINVAADIARRYNRNHAKQCDCGGCKIYVNDRLAHVNDVVGEGFGLIDDETGQPIKSMHNSPRSDLFTLRVNEMELITWKMLGPETIRQIINRHIQDMDRQHS